MHFLLGKDMDWAKMLAEDKNINIIVEDSTTAADSLGELGAAERSQFEPSKTTNSSK